MWYELRRDVHIHKPANIEELKIFSMEEHKSAASVSKFVGHYRKRLSGVIFSREFFTMCINYGDADHFETSVLQDSCST